MKNLFKFFISFAMIATSVNGFAASTRPAAPVCEKEVSQPDENGTSIRVQNYDCLRQWNIHYTALSMWDAEDKKGADQKYNGPQEPVKPVASNCAGDDHACLVKDQTALAAYNRQKHIYDVGQQMAAQTAATTAAEAERLRKIQEASKSASGGFSAVSDENKAGSQIYQAAAMAAATFGAQKVTEAAGCGNPACAAALTAVAAAAFAQMGKAKSQAKRMDFAQYSACNSANQTGAIQTDCGAPPTTDNDNPYDPTTLEGVKGLGPDGKCKPNEPKCDAMVADSRYKGLDFKPLAGAANGFASDNNGLRISKDGIVTLPNGQTTTVDALMSREGMLKAGIAASEIDAMLSKMNAAGASMAALDSKKELDELNKESAMLTEGGLITGGAAGTGSGNSLNGEGSGKKDITKRKPSSEGLVREFNGEMIGAAGDDIFSMMNRRYQLKSEQDSFMGPK